MIHDPAIGEHYIERKSAVSLLTKRVNAFRRGYRQNVGLIGQRYMGKTSILQNFILSNATEECIPVYIQLVPEPFDYFAKRYMGTILQAFMRAQGIIIPSTFDGLVKRTRKYLPETLRRMRRVKYYIDRKDNDRAFEILLTLTASLSEESKWPVIVVLDEFDLLQQFGLRDPFGPFSQEIMVQKNTMFVVSSSRPSVAHKIFREKLSLLFGNFETCSILPFDYNEAITFIYRRLGHIRIEETFVKLLVRLTDGHPYFLDLMMDKLYRLARANGNIVNEAVMIEMFSELFYRSSGGIHQHFALQLNVLRKNNFLHFYLNILLAIAIGKKKLHDIARFIEKDKEETKKGLQRLMEERLVERSGYFYFIKEALLRFWLKNVFHRKFVNLGVSGNDNELAFRNEMFDLIDSTCHEEQKELLKRVEELLRSFGNDVIEVKESRMKCPNFNEVYLRPTNGRIYPLYAKSSSTRWLCQVAEKAVDEDDIQTLIEDAKRMRTRVNKRILIAPRGISLNAKLMAKQAKITIWNLRNLNFVFDLYDKPKVIMDSTDIPSLSEVILEEEPVINDYAQA